MTTVTTETTSPFSSSRIIETQRHEREPGSGVHSILVSLQNAAREVLRTRGTNWTSWISTCGTDLVTGRFLRVASPGVIYMLAEELLRRRQASADQQTTLDLLHEELATLQRRYDVAITTLAATRGGELVRRAA